MCTSACHLNSAQGRAVAASLNSKSRSTSSTSPSSDRARQPSCGCRSRFSWAHDRAGRDLARLSLGGLPVGEPRSELGCRSTVFGARQVADAVGMAAATTMRLLNKSRASSPPHQRLALDLVDSRGASPSAPLLPGPLADVIGICERASACPGGNRRCPRSHGSTSSGSESSELGLIEHSVHQGQLPRRSLR